MYIDENGVPEQNRSTVYSLLVDGKKYPPKYVIAVAAKLANSMEIRTDTYNEVEAKNYFEARGFMIENKQEKFELTITAEAVTSTDSSFTMENLSLGDDYKPIDVYFQPIVGEKVKRIRNKSENRISNKTLPRLVCQIFESQINSLSDSDMKAFPICQYSPDKEMIRGIFRSEVEYKNYRNSAEMTVYKRENGPQFVFYSWNIFTTIIFTQECLKRFGNTGDKFVLIYRDKTEQEKNWTSSEKVVNEDVETTTQEVKNKYSRILLESKNIIFRGAPGTGKSYLANAIAADIISNGYTDRYDDLTAEQKQQVEFVQFHPSYDYSDFVEGLRPKMNEDGSMGFELQDGIFKAFVDRARRNIEETRKTKEERQQETSARAVMSEYFSDIEYGAKEYETIRGSKCIIMDMDEKHIYISIPDNPSINKLTLYVDNIQKMLEYEGEIEKVSDMMQLLGRTYTTQGNSYELAIYKDIKASGIKGIEANVMPEDLKKYIFIIDEINRGEISKIFGELFFSIDPGYRGPEGSVSTQYSNMHDDPNEKFYIPENVYIIGTMNDIDRSVDTFDFAMRRRFRFVEIKAEDTMDMLESLDNEELKNEAVERMEKLNDAILTVEDLNENYQIGASYFLKAKSVGFDVLWTDYLCPLLQEYVRGLNNEYEIMKRFEDAYGYIPKDNGALDEAIQD